MTETLLFDIQHATKTPFPFNDEQLASWVSKLLEPHLPCELTLRIVEKNEIHELNKTFRQKDKPTNVLAFPADPSMNCYLPTPFLGDVIICPEVIQEESLLEKKTLEAHTAHIVLHGILHLLGYDHINESDEKEMKQQEVHYLKLLGFSNPYKVESEHDNER